VLLLDLSPVFQLVPGLWPRKPAIGFLLLALVKEAILFSVGPAGLDWTALRCAARYLVQQSLINPDPGLVAPPLPTLQAVPVPASRLPPSSISTQISSPSPSSQLFLFSFNLVPRSVYGAYTTRGPPRAPSQSVLINQTGSSQSNRPIRSAR
jgi:hypothetical protein